MLPTHSSSLPRTAGGIPTASPSRGAADSTGSNTIPTSQVRMRVQPMMHLHLHLDLTIYCESNVPLWHTHGAIVPRRRSISLLVTATPRTADTDAVADADHVPFPGSDHVSVPVPGFGCKPCRGHDSMRRTELVWLGRNIGTKLPQREAWDATTSGPQPHRTDGHSSCHARIV